MWADDLRCMYYIALKDLFTLSVFILARRLE
jgi:hypothetical protein